MSQSPSDWITQGWDEEGDAYPFIEDENGNITGLGHQNTDDFADAVNRYDQEECGTEPQPYTHEDIALQWVTAERDGSGDGDVLHPCGADTPGAFAVTTLWGAR